MRILVFLFLFGCGGENAVKPYPDIYGAWVKVEANCGDPIPERIEIRELTAYMGETERTVVDITPKRIQFNGLRNDSLRYEWVDKSEAFPHVSFTWYFGFKCGVYRRNR